MFQITFIEHTDTCFNHYIVSDKTGTKAVIYPTFGASLQQFYVNDKPIINNIIGTGKAPKLLNSSCSAVLFPFANRINKGQYDYQGTSYQLDCNETARGHAMHGLVYRQAFDLLDSTMHEDAAIIRFVYQQDNQAAGFPFPFKILLTYTLKKEGLSLEVVVENLGTQSFPFSLGWHPYFYSTNLEESILLMNSQAQIQTDETMIPIGIQANDFPNPLQLDQKVFDTGFILETSEIQYKTPDYQLKMNIEQDMSKPYVQLYIPNHRQSIAIEPMTAATDCYNNGWGTRELLPQKNYSAIWKIEVSTDI
ncbi:MAG: aldose 1-epimerase [Aureispira sp.]|nr:aldose 1-epimerase [Aureispira sp.]